MEINMASFIKQLKDKVSYPQTKKASQTYLVIKVANLKEIRKYQPQRQTSGGGNHLVMLSIRFSFIKIEKLRHALYNATIKIKKYFSLNWFSFFIMKDIDESEVWPEGSKPYYTHSGSCHKC